MNSKKKINSRANVKFIIFIIITILLVFLKLSGYLPSLF